MKFWSYLENKEKDSIAYQCLTLSKKLTDAGNPSIVNKINSLNVTYNLDPSSISNNKHNIKNIIPYIKENIKNYLETHQMNLIKSNKKLEFYSTFKKDTKQSEYLDNIKNSDHKRTLSKLKIGNHDLRNGKTYHS